jgi:membrane-associated protease RseP (regulator of RpoE activity)
VTLLDFVLYTVICLLAHELGHVLAARAVGVEVKRLGLGWRGMYIRRARSEGWRESMICLAGPMANLLLAIVVRNQHWLALCSLEFALINLLPFAHSDGRHAWAALREMMVERTLGRPSGGTRNG